MEKLMAMVVSLMYVVTYTKETGRMTKRKTLGYIIMQMVANTKDHGRTINKQDSAL